MLRFPLRSILAVLHFLLLSQFADAQTQAPPFLQWQKCIGGSGLDAASKVIKTFDGNYMVIGATESVDGDVTTNHGQLDVFLVKLSPTGTILWKETYGGSGDEEGLHLMQTADSGYIILAYATSPDGDLDTNYGLRDVWVLKLSKTGAVQWKKSYGGSANEMALGIRQTFDGGYIFAGWSASANGDLTSNQGIEDCWIVKLDAMGAITWQKSLGGSGEDHFTSVIQTNDGGYLAVGSVKSGDGDITGHHGSDDVWIVKFNAAGNVTWKKIYGGTGEDHCGDHAIAGAVVQTFDGGYVLTAFSNSSDGDVIGNKGDYDAWILKLSSTGAITWQKSIGGTGDDQANHVIQTPDSGYVIAGLTNSLDGDVDTMYGVYDVWCFKLAKSGNLIWEQTFGGIYKEVAFGLDATADTGLILAGYSTFANGQVSGSKGGMYDMWVVKLKMPPGVNGLPSAGLSSLNISPNPTSGFINVRGTEEPMTLELYNITGQRLKQSHSRELSFPELPAGMYLLKVFDKNQMQIAQEKIVKY